MILRSNPPREAPGPPREDNRLGFLLGPVERPLKRSTHRGGKYVRLAVVEGDDGNAIAEFILNQICLGHEGIIDTKVANAKRGTLVASTPLRDGSNCLPDAHDDPAIRLCLQADLTFSTAVTISGTAVKRSATRP